MAASPVPACIITFRERHRTPTEGEPALVAPSLGRGLLLVWARSGLLMLLLGLQDEWREGSRACWRPVLAEDSSALVATLIAVVQWRLVQRLDALLAHPLRWFARVLVWMPLVAAGFVLAIYGLRWGVRAGRVAA